MANETYQLAILLSVKDAASGQLDRAAYKLRDLGKEGRNALKEYEALRQGLAREMSIAGVGLAGLTSVRAGIQVAADYEQSLLNLKSAYQEVSAAGGLSVEEQKRQLKELQTLATDMGDKLQGDTSAYVSILTSLKKSGVETTTILQGAGRAAAYLANVSGTLTSGLGAEQAKELGQFGKMFQLRPQEFEPMVNLFSALQDRFDIGSSSLIESSKYFQATASQLGMLGFEGAQDTAKFFAFLKRYAALEGSQAGTSGTSFFTQYTAHGKALSALKKQTGIDLKFFNEKGAFVGLDKVVAQMQQFKKLSAEKQKTYLNSIFGEQGEKVAVAMITGNVEGWKSITSESAKAVDVNEKINQQMETLNAKTEALTGSLQNLVAVGFTPMVNSVKPLVDTGNYALGWARQFAEMNPTIAGTATEIIGVTSAVLALKGGVSSLITIWKLWKLTSAVSRGEGLTEYFTKVREDARKTEVALATPTKQAGLLRRTYDRIPSSLITNIKLVGVGLVLEQLFQVNSEVAKRMAELEELKKSTSQVFKDYYNLRQGYQFTSSTGNQEPLRQVAEDIGKRLTQNQDFSRTFDRYGSFTNVWENLLSFDMESLPERKRKSFVDVDRRLLFPEVMAQYIMGLRSGKIHSDMSESGRKNIEAFISKEPYFQKSYSESLKLIETLTKQATEQQQQAFNQSVNQFSAMFGQSLNTSNQGLLQFFNSTQQTSQSLDGMQKPVEQTTDSMSKLPNAINSATNAANNFANQVNNLRTQSPSLFNKEKLDNVTIQTDDMQSVPFIKPPHKASGGRVLSSGLAYIHSGEDIVPANVTSEYDRVNSLNQLTQGLIESNKPSTQLNYSPNLTVNVYGKGNAEDIKNAVRDALYEHERDIERIVAKRLGIRKERS